MTAHLRRRRARLAGGRGFSLIELLTVVVVSSMGFVALFGMQIGTLRGLAQTRHIIEATNLAENQLALLRIELMRWTDNPGEGLADLTFPSLAGLPTDAAAAAGSTSAGGDVVDAPGWVIAGPGGDDRRVSVVGQAHEVNSDTLNEGARAAMIDPEMEEFQRSYCLHYRLTWLIPGRLVRADVEASWPLEHADMEQFVQCDQLAAAQLAAVRSVNLNSTISVNLFQR